MKILHLIGMCILLLSFHIGIAQYRNGPVLDSASPAISVKESLDNSYFTGYLKDKFIVLDFWATWCAPCIAGFPHFNELVENNSANKKLVFVTITDEDRKKTELFFKRSGKQLKGIKLLDDSAKTMKAFNVTSIPTAAMLDNKGIVRWKGETKDLTQAILDSVMNSIPLASLKTPVAQEKPYIDPVVRQYNNKAMFGILISRSADSSQTDNASGSWGNLGNDYTDITYNRKRLLDFISFLLGRNPDARFRVTNREKANFKIDVFFKTRKVRDSSFIDRYIPGRPNINLLLHYLSEIFTFDIRVVNEKIPGYQLVVVDSMVLKGTETLHFNPKGSSHASISDNVNGLVEIANHNMNDITVELESNLKVPVKNVTGADKKYDVTINVRNIKEANLQLAKYGLALKETTNEPFEIVYIDFK